MTQENESSLTKKKMKVSIACTWTSTNMAREKCLKRCIRHNKSLNLGEAYVGSVRIFDLC